MTAPQFQLCSDSFSNFSRLARSADNVFVSPKLDGFRCGVTLAGKSVRYWSRNGLPFPLFEVFPAVPCGMQWMDGDSLYPLDCELTHPDGIEVLREIVQGRIIARYPELELNIFDIIVPDMPLLTRTEILAEAFACFRPDVGPGSVRLVEHDPLEGPLTKENLDWYRDDFVRQGFEGAVFKVADAVYLPGLSPYWLRRVPFQSADLPVVGWKTVFGDGSRIASLTCDTGKALVVVSAGFTAEQRREFAHRPPEVVEVFHRGVTRRGSLRSPVFRRVRPDKVVHAGS